MKALEWTPCPHSDYEETIEGYCVGNDGEGAQPVFGLLFDPSICENRVIYRGDNINNAKKACELDNHWS